MVHRRIVPPRQNVRPLFQYNLNGTLVRRWDFLEQACRELKLPYTGLYQCINGDVSSYRGFIWLREIPFERCYRLIYGKKPSQELIDAARERYYMERDHPNSPAEAPQGATSGQSTPQSPNVPPGG